MARIPTTSRLTAQLEHVSLWTATRFSSTRTRFTGHFLDGVEENAFLPSGGDAVSQAVTGFPRGWFMVCYSDELPVGETRPLRYFGQHLAAYRGEDGQVRVLDAHCPHMGAHLGVKGVVIGNLIACPFHGWRF